MKFITLLNIPVLQLEYVLFIPNPNNLFFLKYVDHSPAVHTYEDVLVIHGLCWKLFKNVMRMS